MGFAGAGDAGLGNQDLRLKWAKYNFRKGSTELLSAAPRLEEVGTIVAAWEMLGSQRETARGASMTGLWMPCLKPFISRLNTN